MANTILEMRNITKTFPGVKALENVNLKVKEGEIHALVGENGAGKSTLLRLIAGELQLDQGSLRLQAGARIGMVRQEAPSGELTPLEAVLATDTERAALLAEAGTVKDPLRIAEVHNRLAEIRASMKRPDDH